MRMNKMLCFVFAALAIVVGGGCRDFPTNNKLDNQWQITTIEYADGTEARPSGLYYCFYRDVVQLTTGGVRATGNLSQSGSILTMSFPYSTATELVPWGLTVGPDEPVDEKNPVYEVEIEQLDGSSLVMLTSRSIRITCRKF